ncbi:hypothetical protein C8R44DRAFT_751444 [Mycena epipterygia]|nr:hypothetical protein C8R44DRAFT_751444 [Mycena epipterygia]
MSSSTTRGEYGLRRQTMSCGLHERRGRGAPQANNAPTFVEAAGTGHPSARRATGPPIRKPHVLALCDTHDRPGPRTFGPSSVTHVHPHADNVAHGKSGTPREHVAARASQRRASANTCRETAHAWVHHEPLCSLRPALDVPSAGTTSNPAAALCAPYGSASPHRAALERDDVPRIIGAASLERNALARRLAYSRKKHAWHGVPETALDVHGMIRSTSTRGSTTGGDVEGMHMGRRRREWEYEI